MLVSDVGTADGIRDVGGGGEGAFDGPDKH